MNHILSTPVPKAAPATLWQGNDTPPLSASDHYQTIYRSEVETPRRLRSEEQRIATVWPGGHTIDPANEARKACFGTSAVYSCLDKQCPVRDTCTKAVSPWRF